MANALSSAMASAAKKKKGDVENAADAKMPGDAAEDAGSSALASALSSGSANLKRKAQFGNAAS
jgi:hypothetical protein